MYICNVITNKPIYSPKKTNIMKYRLIQKRNPQDPEGVRKWYAIPVNAGTLSFQELAAEIAGRSSLTLGDVENVLRNLLEQLPVFLRMGMSVKLGDFGTFRLSLSSRGADSPDVFDANTYVQRTRLIFTPGVLLKAAISKTSVEQALDPTQDPSGGA